MSAAIHLPGIIGVGTDLVELARIYQVWEERGESFLSKICLPREQAYIRDHARPWERLGGIFAAKEAVSKAFGTGIGEKLGWLDIEVTRSAEGQGTQRVQGTSAPALQFHGKGAQLACEKNVTQALISISHTHEYATAFCVLTSAMS